MKSSELAAALAPFAILANKHAMSPTYKALEIGPDCIRGCSPWGILELDIEIGTSETFWVDAAQLIGVVKTLSGEIAFTVAGTTLTWECGSAKGKLSLLTKIEIPEADWDGIMAIIDTPNVEAPMPEALSLGSLSASRDMGLSSNGVAGVSLHWGPLEEGVEVGTLFVVSSDAVTMSVASIEMIGALHWPENIVIATEAAAMLSMVLRASAASSGAYLDIQEKTIVAAGGDYRLMIRSAPTFKHNVLELTKNFPHDEVTADLPKDGVKQFIARATTLAEARAHTFVRMNAINGKLLLAFSEDTTTTEEEYILDGFVVPKDFPEVRLDASRFARALGYVDKIAFDALDRSVITLFAAGEDRKLEFAYLINGAQEKAA